MTTIPQQLLNEKRLRKLKLRNIQWISVPPPSRKYQSSSTARRAARSKSSSKNQPNNQEIKKPYFMNSEISFSNKEMQILKENDSANRPYTSISRPHQSSLEQLQAQNKTVESDRKLSLSLSAKGSTSSKINIIPSPTGFESLERSDSIISFKEVEFDEDESNNIQNQQKLGHNSRSAIFNTASVTIGDIKDNVWMWCHDHNEKNNEKSRSVNFFNANFVKLGVNPQSHIENYQLQQPQYKHQQNRQKQIVKPSSKQTADFSDIDNENVYHPENQNLAVTFNSNAGERKVKNIIKSYSKIEQERQAIENEFDQKHEHNEYTDQIKRSYCAYQYQKYCYDNNGNVPYFLDDIDFTDVKKAKMNMRKNRTKKNIASRNDE